MKVEGRNGSDEYFLCFAVLGRQGGSLGCTMAAVPLLANQEVRIVGIIGQ